MKLRRFYAFALWLPLILLVAVSIGEAALRQLMAHEMSAATGYVLLFGVMGGIQYLLFTAAVTWRFARMDEAFLKRISWVMPIMFFPVCIVGLWIFFEVALLHASQALTVSPERGQQDVLAFCIRLGMYAVLVGYAYVVCVHASARGLRHMGLLEE